MMTSNRIKPVWALVAVVIAAFAFNAGADAAKPLRVYILAGQSNMQGHAHVRTFDAIGMDPKTAPMLKEMRGADGTPRVCEKVDLVDRLCGRRAGRPVDHRLWGEGARPQDRAGIHVRDLYAEAAG